MAGWQYRVVTHVFEWARDEAPQSEVEKFREALDRVGSEGWELATDTLIALPRKKWGHQMIFKMPLSD